MMHRGDLLKRGLLQLILRSPSATTEYRRFDFDQLAKDLAKGLSRREALRRVGIGLAGAMLAPLILQKSRPALASTSCVCTVLGSGGGGVVEESYDPATSCCTSSGVLPKYPITDLNAFPNRVRHPGYMPSANGCGTVHLQGPDHFGKADFRACCDYHDLCYDDCSQRQAQCDGTSPPAYKVPVKQRTAPTGL